jgi:uncharacterized protein involved in copper resistance
MRVDLDHRRRRRQLVLASPVIAQTDPPAMQMPWPTSPPQTQASAQTRRRCEPDHAQMDHGAMDEGAMGEGAVDHSQMDHGANGSRTPTLRLSATSPRRRRRPTTRPSASTAPRRWRPRAVSCVSEHGGAIVSNLMLDMAELQFGDDETDLPLGRRGLDRRRHQSLRLQDRRRGRAKTMSNSAEVQALYSRAIGPYFDLQAGVRYDVEPSPNRAYAVLGFEGVAPYWFETTGALFRLRRRRGERPLGRLIRCAPDAAAHSAAARRDQSLRRRHPRARTGRGRDRRRAWLCACATTSPATSRLMSASPTRPNSATPPTMPAPPVKTKAMRGLVFGVRAQVLTLMRTQ